jgi:peptide/nickel transport system substrate-binding protein
MTPPRFRAALVAVAATASLTLSSCTGTEDAASAPTADGMIPYLNYGDFGGGEMPKENYNPFLLATKLSATEYLYERLMIVETYSCEEIPWLATGYEWADDKTLVFDIRDGVKWNDGEDLTATDVAFTFNLIKEHDVLDTAGVWQYLDSVEETGDQQVTFTFKEPGASAFQMINGVPIVPEHIWSKVEDPTTFTNAKDPVGTGPMTVKQFNPRELTIERNPDYWQAEDLKVQEIRFHKADSGGQVEQLKLSRGEYDHQGMYVPDIDKTYVSRDPEHHKYWYAPGGVIAVYMNLEKEPFSDVEFRRALTTAFDYDKVVEKAQLGYVEQASQTGLVIPGQEEWLPEGVENEGKMPFDPEAADQALTEAGYEKDADGNRVDENGNPIKFSFKVPGEYLDWVAASDILVENLQELGFDVEQDTPSPDVHNEDRSTGNYDMMFGVYGGSCDMYRNFADPLDSKRTAPTGKPALTNETRWKDPETDELLQDLKVATDEAAQKEAVAGLAEIMVDEVPNIPVWYGAKWFQYNTKRAVGWPNAENPYVGSNDFLPMLMHLRPADGGDEG